MVRSGKDEVQEEMGEASATPDGDELMSETYQATSVINQVLEAVIGMMNGTHPFGSVTRGALPTGPGLVCEIGPSTPETVHMDKNTVIPLDVTLNGKHHNLKTVSDAMNEIHSALTRAKEYPSAERWQIVDITNQTLPQRIGREQNNDWLMASALSVKFYWRGD
jgi:hypothetical protein